MVGNWYPTKDAFDQDRSAFKLVKVTLCKILLPTRQTDVVNDAQAQRRQNMLMEET